MLILLKLFSIFGHTKFIINFNKVHYKISTMVAFCPCGLLPGLMSGGLLSVHRSWHWHRSRVYRLAAKLTVNQSLQSAELTAPGRLDGLHSVNTTCLLGFYSDSWPPPPADGFNHWTRLHVTSEWWEISRLVPDLPGATETVAHSGQKGLKVFI